MSGNSTDIQYEVYELQQNARTKLLYQSDSFKHACDYAWKQHKILKLNLAVYCTYSQVQVIIYNGSDTT